MASKSKYPFLLYFISPFIALLSAIYSYRSKWAKNIVWGFVIFYGFTLVISTTGMDANRYRDKFLVMAEEQSSLREFISILYNQENGYADVLHPVSSFIVSKFTSDPRFLFAVFGLIFGYFYSRNIWLLLENKGDKLKLTSIPLVITFAFIIGFWNINGFRFWTAAHVFFFGGIRAISTEQRKGLLITAFSPLIHFSFILPVSLILIYFLLKNRVHLYFGLFVATFFVAELDIIDLRQILTDILPDALDAKVEGYTHEEHIANYYSKRQNLSWYAAIYQDALKWTLAGFLTIMYLKGIHFIQRNKHLLSILSFSFLFLAVGNIVSLAPSGSRFLTVAYLFATTAIFLYLQHAPGERLMHRLMPLATLALALYCIVTLRMGFDTIGVMTVLGNPFLALFGTTDISLIELIK